METERNRKKEGNEERRIETETKGRNSNSPECESIFPLSDNEH